MVAIKKQLKAYILLESLVALGILVTIASLMLSQLSRHQQLLVEQIEQQEILNVATMAVQTGEDQLTVDGLTVQVVREPDRIEVRSGGKVVMSLAKD